MTNELSDPNLPPGAVIAVDDKTGIATRNDGGKLQPAAKNPWYVLATIAGEQTGMGIDHTLHEKNRRYWNGWACAGMDDETRAALANKMDLPPEDLAPLSKAELAKVRQEFDRRLGKTSKIPASAETIDFQETYFPMPFGMGKYVLAQWADFTSATFSAVAVFISATFSAVAVFTSATFSAVAVFTSATFSDWADFSAATFSAKAKFRSAVFNGTAEFSDGGFGGATSFENAHFLGKMDGVPTFYQRSFHHYADFTIKPEHWPPITPDNAGHSKDAYTRLRQIMNDLYKSDAEEFFSRQELRCSAERAKGLHKLIGRGFDLFSDYGYSITRPLWGLAVVVGLCWGILGSQMTGDLGPETAPAIARGLGLSFSNTFAFFGFQRLYFDTAEIRAMPGWTHWLGAVQTVLGFILVFLLGLGLRNRFRLK